MRSRRASPPQRQRGVALITAMIIFTLAMMLAADVAFRAYLDQRRATALFAVDQAYEIALGAEAWAADILQQDARESDEDNLGENWAQPLPVLPVDDIGTMTGRLVDMQGRFNINDLVHKDGTPNEDKIHQLERVLAKLDLEPAWAATLADWIDSDTQTGFPEGAEDSEYTSQTPPHRAANMPVTRVSELLVLPEFGIERYRKLEPYLAALPIETPMNVCTAPGILIDALKANEEEFGVNAKDLAKRRKEACFPTLDDVRNFLGDTEFDRVENQLTVSSSYFGATVWISIGTSEYTLYSLLHRGSGAPPASNALVRPILRSFGTN